MTIWIKVAWSMLLASLLAIVMYSVFSYGEKVGRLDVQSKWDAEIIALQQSHIAELERVREDSEKIRENLNTIQEKSKNEINSIKRRHDAIINSLRNTESNQDSTVNLSENGDTKDVVGCAKTKLSRADAEFLVGLATDAELTKEALNSCMSQYKKVETILNAD